MKAHQIVRFETLPLFCELVLFPSLPSILSTTTTTTKYSKKQEPHNPEPTHNMAETQKTNYLQFNQPANSYMSLQTCSNYGGSVGMPECLDAFAFISDSFRTFLRILL